MMAGKILFDSMLPAWSAGFLVKAAVLLAIVLILIWFQRRASAAARHQLLALVALTVLLLPLVSLLVPQWQLGWITMPTAAESAPDALGSATSSAAGETAAPTRSWWSVALITVWLSGSAILLTLLVLGRVRGLAAVRAARPLVNEHLVHLISALSDRLGLKHRVEVLTSERIKVPVVFGWWSPRLILPRSLAEAAPAGLEAILIHELAHIKRYDVLTQSLAQLMCCLHWPNPLAWMVERRLMIERERACDDIVLLSGGRASEYAKALMDSAGALGTSRNPVWAMAAMAEGTDFKDRVLSILDPNALRGVPTLSRALASAVVVLLGTVLVAAAQPFAIARVSPAPDLTISLQSIPAVEPDHEPVGKRDDDSRQQVSRIEDESPVDDPSTVSRLEDKQVQAAVGALFDAFGEVVVTAARDEQTQPEAEAMQELFSSIGNMVREGDDEQAARREVARFFMSIGKLVVADSQAEPEQPPPAAIPSQEGGGSG